MSNVYDLTGKLLNQPAPQMAGYSGVDMDVVDWFETLPGKKYLAEVEALEALEAPAASAAEVPAAPVVETPASVEIPAVVEAPASVVEASVEAPIVPVAEVATAPAQA